MEIFLILVQAFIALAMIGFILLQKSEGGGLVSQQGGQAMGRFMTRRGQSDFLTRTTTLLATAFMSLCLLIAIISSHSSKKNSLLDQVASEKKASLLASAAKKEATQNENEPQSSSEVASPIEGLVSTSTADASADSSKAAAQEVSVAAPNQAAA